MEIEKMSQQLAKYQTVDLKVTPVVPVEDVLKIDPSQLIDAAGDRYQAGTLSPYTIEQLQVGIEEANRLLVGKNTKFSYQVHEGTGRTIVQLLDMETDEVVKEIPPVKLLDSLAKLWEAAGIVVNQKG